MVMNIISHFLLIKLELFPLLINFMGLNHKKGKDMSLEALDQLQEKVQKMLEANALLQMEIEEFKEKNIVLEEKINAISAQQKDLVDQNNELKQEKTVWQNRLNSLLGKMDDI